jgi:hypothetical protein
MTLTQRLWILAGEEQDPARKQMLRRLGDVNYALSNLLKMAQTDKKAAVEEDDRSTDPDVEQHIRCSPEFQRLEQEYWLLYSVLFPESEPIYPEQYAAARA